MTNPQPPPLPTAATPSTIVTVCSAGAITLCADYLLWPVSPGLSLGLLAVLLGLVQMIFLGPPRWGWGMWGAVVLLFPSCVQSAVELSFPNALVISLLLVALLSERFDCVPSWTFRFFDAAAALIRAPGRWLWVAKAVYDHEGYRGTIRENSVRTAGAFQVAAPALLLGGAFTAILSGGNAILRDWVSRVFRAVADWIVHLDLSIGRFLFWAAVATAALAFIRPVGGFAGWWGAGRSLPKWGRCDPRLARKQCITVMVVLNLLFFIANTIDVFYLWLHAVLPEGVSHTTYVHEGVNSLIIAVLLSAVVLTVIFHHGPEVTGGRVLKAAAHVWILQNIIMIGGVLLRLKMYVDVFELTTLRIYVACFLLLVFSGFIILAAYVEGSKGLGWLIVRNLQATFALFFLLQFADVAAWVGEWNVARWLENSTRPLDVPYLAALGPGAWPYLIRVAEQDQSRELSEQAAKLLNDIARDKRDIILNEDWRAIQIRRDRGIRLVMNAAAKASTASR